MVVAMFKRLFALPVSALLVSSALAQVPQPTYKLGPGDKVRIRVSEWRPARGEVVEWEAVNGEFTVNDAGRVSMPILGELRAAGIGSDELAQAVGEQLQKRMGLVQRPEASVEVLAFRPFYILGGVNRPGEYQYRPGLTVLQAVGVAGGFYRASASRVQRELIVTAGELRLIDLSKGALLARKARLEAELTGNAEVKFPPRLLASQNIVLKQFIQQEQSIFDSRLHAVRSQIESLEQLKSLLAKQIQSLQEKYALQDRQLTLARKELDLVNSLVSKGLTVNARQLSLEQTSAQMESARLDLSVAMLRAQEDLSKASRDILTLQNKRREDSAVELKETQLKLEEATQKTETAGQLIGESDVESRSSTVPILSILRQTGDNSRETVVPEDARVEPGDVVRVRVPLGTEQPEGEADERGAPRRQSSASGVRQ